MSEIVTQKAFSGTDGWRLNSINRVRDWYCQWIESACAVRCHWRILAADEAWTKILKDEPRTEERLREQMIGVRDERLWTILTDLLNLIDEIDKEERKQVRMDLT